MSRREILIAFASRLLVLLGALLGCTLWGCQRSPDPAAAVPGPTAKAETAATDRADDLKNARLAAEGFLTAVAAGNPEQAQGFCSPAQRERVVIITREGPATWVIEGDAIGSGGRDATFKGTITCNGKRMPFVTQVVKAKEANRDHWLVDAFSLGDPQ
jgi:hypothetical protein